MTKTEQMIPKNTAVLLAIGVAVLLLLLSLYLLNERIKIESNKRLLSGQIVRVERKAFNFDVNRTMTGKKAFDILCNTKDGDNKQLSKFMVGLPILIYRYTQDNCTPCYEEQLHLLQELFGCTPELVVILASYHRRRDFLVSARNNLEVSMYNIPAVAFDWQLDKAGVPYYFVLHPNMKISNIYIPNEHEPELNRQYLESIKRLLQ